MSEKFHIEVGSKKSAQNLLKKIHQKIPSKYMGSSSKNLSKNPPKICPKTPSKKIHQKNLSKKSVNNQGAASSSFSFPQLQLVSLVSQQCPKSFILSLVQSYTCVSSSPSILGVRQKICQNFHQNNPSKKSFQKIHRKPANQGAARSSFSFPQLQLVSLVSQQYLKSFILSLVQS